MDELNKLQAIVENSNLVATACEFIPKSHGNLSDSVGCLPRGEDPGPSRENVPINGAARPGTGPGRDNEGAPRRRQPSRWHHGEGNSRGGRAVGFTSNTNFFQFNDCKTYGRRKKINNNEGGSVHNEPALNYGHRGTSETQQRDNLNFSTSSQTNKNNIDYSKPGIGFDDFEAQNSVCNDQKSLGNSNMTQGQSGGKYFISKQHSQIYSKFVQKGLVLKVANSNKHQDRAISHQKIQADKKHNEMRIKEKQWKDSYVHKPELTNRQQKKQVQSGETVQVANQREQLIDALMHGMLECLVCCESISQYSSVWNCSNCYHVLHLKCVIKWARSSKSDYGWRCPACQNVSEKIPETYYCFCGKTRDPEWNHQDCPHSCGEVCGKSYCKPCPHKCTLLCHPGPCPQCTATVIKSCGCKRTTKTVQCFGTEEVVCDQICGKELNCLMHTCSKKCHSGSCKECDQLVNQDCYCNRHRREVKCTVDVLGSSEFSCGELCLKKLSCGYHLCSLICHEGECPECDLTPSVVKVCPCGQTDLKALMAEPRTLCTDPIPTCELVCGKALACGPPDKAHKCKSTCHEESCPECPLETMIKCRCGHKSKMLACRKLKELPPEGTLCDKRCTKKRSCGKHKCNQVCCTGTNHDCPLPCNRFLLCGLHKCEETCHRGHCKPCLRASFEELACECGAEVIFPPVPCGTRRPPCERPCTRIHDCDHPPVHSCHSGSQCPPCTVLTKKYCHGRHELRKAVPCHLDSFSCGLPCGKELKCSRHKCILPCHSGSCLKPDEECSQPCTKRRTGCGHICGTPCHENPCSPEAPCKEMVKVTCECGRKFTTRPCHENAKEFQRIVTAKLATKMADLQAGQTIDLNDVAGANKKVSYKTLDCDDECKLIERNRRLAIALQIRNPDLSAKLTPRYSEYLKNWAKRDPRFCQMVHDKLTDLVQLAKQSKQKCRSYSFDPMNREKRHFIHEYCDHFGCESVAYDQEPKRNVVATALKYKSWLPSVSIIEFTQKENSPRKVPVPVFVKSSPQVITPRRHMEVLSSRILTGSQASNSNESVESEESEVVQKVDYFDWRPQHT